MNMMNDKIPEHYDDTDVDEMLQKLEEIYEDETRSGRRFSSFYQIMNEVAEHFSQHNIDNKYQTKNIRRIHHDMISINNTFVDIEKDLHISNMIKLYEKGFVSEKSLEEEIVKSKKINLKHIYGDVYHESQQF